MPNGGPKNTEHSTPTAMRERGERGRGILHQHCQNVHKTLLLGLGWPKVERRGFDTNASLVLQDWAPQVKNHIAISCSFVL